MRFPARVALAATAFLTSLACAAQTGTFVLDVEPFQSAEPLKPKLEQTIKTGGIEWGVRDGQVVITLVNKRFLDFDIPYTTRYGSRQTVELPVGSYKVTVAGMEARTAFSVDKALAKGAYFNEDVIEFQVEAGKTTTLALYPLMKSDAIFGSKMYIPTLTATVTTDTGTTEPIVINNRDDSSISWPDYNGPLKFIVK